MPNVIAITKTEFAKKSWKRYTDFLFTADDSLCRLGASELPAAMMAMPLAFVPTDGEYSIMGVLGLQQGTNFFVSADGNWMGDYIPAAYRLHPFVLVNDTSREGNSILCINSDAGLLLDNDTEERFYDDDLQPSKEIIQIGELCSRVNFGRQESDRICKILSRHDLIKPWELEIETENGTKELKGLFCVDEVAVNGLSDGDYSELRVAGAITFIYCQLLSMQRVTGLTLLARKMLEAGFLRQSSEINFDEGSGDGNISFANL